MIDWSKCPEVESVPGKLNGKLVFRHTRLPVAVLFGNLALGATVKDVVEWYDVDEAQLVAVLNFVAEELNKVEHAEVAAM